MGAYGRPLRRAFSKKSPGFLGKIVTYQNVFFVGTQLASSARPQRAAGLIK